MKGKDYLLILIIGLVISSCSKSVEYDKPVFEEKIVVESYLIGNDSMMIVRLEKSTSPYEESFANDKKKKVQNATVKLFFNNTEYILEEHNDNYLLLYDGNAIAPWGTYYKKKIKVPDNTKCLLTVNYNQQNITSYSEFPKNTKINYCSAKLDQHGDKLGAKITINSDFPNNEINYYRVRASCNTYYNGFSYISKSAYFYFTKNGRDLNNAINFYWDIQSITSNMSKPEKLLIYLDHISEFYYNFREVVKDQSKNYDSPLGSEAIEIPTNIQGGLGIFTCITRDSICVDLIQ